MNSNFSASESSPQSHQHYIPYSFYCAHKYHTNYYPTIASTYLVSGWLCCFYWVRMGPVICHPGLIFMGACRCRFIGCMCVVIRGVDCSVAGVLTVFIAAVLSICVFRVTGVEDLLMANGWLLDCLGNWAIILANLLRTCWILSPEVLSALMLIGQYELVMVVGLVMILVLRLILVFFPFCCWPSFFWRPHLADYSTQLS